MKDRKMCKVCLMDKKMSTALVSMLEANGIEHHSYQASDSGNQWPEISYPAEYFSFVGGFVLGLEWMTIDVNKYIENPHRTKPFDKPPVGRNCPIPSSVGMTCDKCENKPCMNEEE